MLSLFLLVGTAPEITPVGLRLPGPAQTTLTTIFVSPGFSLNAVPIVTIDCGHGTILA